MDQDSITRMADFACLELGRETLREGSVNREVLTEDSYLTFEDRQCWERTRMNCFGMQLGIFL